jgi:uncharacterized protein (TIGR00730 family)
MRQLKRICVFCGSAVGARDSYAEAARALGREVAARGIGLVYGGGAVGLMGIAADAALQAGGEVVGVIPYGLLKREVGHGGGVEMHIVDTMHERKAKMAELSDGFVVLPGGYGTLDGMTREGFIRPTHRPLAMRAGSVGEALDALAGYAAPPGTQAWLRPEQM